MSLRGRYKYIRQGPRLEFGDIFWRSSWEFNFALLLRHLNIKFAFEPQRFWLTKKRTYLPDFRLDSPNPWNTKWIEVKGLWNRGDKAKLKYFIGKYPRETIKVIGREEYMKLNKEYHNIIPGWESAAKKKDIMKKVENKLSETINLGKVGAPHEKPMEAVAKKARPKPVTKKVKK